MHTEEVVADMAAALGRARQIAWLADSKAVVIQLIGIKFKDEIP